MPTISHDILKAVRLTISGSGDLPINRQSYPTSSTSKTAANQAAKIFANMGTRETYYVDNVKKPQSILGLV